MITNFKTIKKSKSKLKNNVVCQNCSLCRENDCDFLNDEIKGISFSNINIGVETIIESNDYIPKKCPYKLEQVVVAKN